MMKTNQISYNNNNNNNNNNDDDDDNYNFNQYHSLLHVQHLKDKFWRIFFDEKIRIS